MERLRQSRFNYSIKCAIFYGETSHWKRKKPSNGSRTYCAFLPHNPIESDKNSFDIVHELAELIPWVLKFNQSFSFSNGKQTPTYYFFHSEYIKAYQPE